MSWKKAVDELGEPRYRARQIAEWLYQKRAQTFEEMTDLPSELRARLGEKFAFTKIDVVRVLAVHATQRNKFLFRLSDESLIETSLLIRLRRRFMDHTVRPANDHLRFDAKWDAPMAANFARAVSRGVLYRNLQPIDNCRPQIIAIERETGEKIDNIVFMGMGEPLANLDNVMRAIQIINAPWGLGISARHITWCPRAVWRRRSGNSGQRAASNPLSLPFPCTGAHGRGVNNQIMPINRRYNLETLLAACDYYAKHEKQHLTFEYILIENVNEFARSGATFGLSECAPAQGQK